MNIFNKTIIAGLFCLSFSGLALADPLTDILFGTLAPPPPYTITPTSPHNFDLDLHDSIGPDSTPYTPVSLFLAGLTAQDTVTITLHNLGGSVDVGSMIMNNIKSTKAHTIAHIVGPTYSMGAMIACSANEIKGDSLTFLMYHNGSTMVGGKTSDVNSSVFANAIFAKKIFNECVKKGILTDSQVNDITSGKDLYLFPDDKAVSQSSKIEAKSLTIYDVSRITKILKDHEPLLIGKAINVQVSEETAPDGGRILEAYSRACFSGCDYMIFISKLNLEFMHNNANWLAGMIAHEMGHMVHGELSTYSREAYCHTSPDSSKQCEKEADLYGKDLTTKSGFDGCDIVNYWKAMKDEFGNDRDSGENMHPDLTTTINYMECK